MEPTLEPAADDQQRERDRKRDHDDPPLPDAAGDANARREPGRGSAGEPANPEVMFGADNDACAEKSDAGEDALYDAAGGVGNLRGIGGGIDQ